MTAAFPEMGPEAFHGPAGIAVETLRPHTEADPVGILLSLLAFAGAMVPDAYAVADGARHPARLNMVLVGKTSRGRKGTAQAQASRVIEKADRYFASERMFGGLASGEGLIAALSLNGSTPADKRAVVLEPEFARLLKVCMRDGSTLSQIVRQAWDSGDLNVLTRKDPLRVRGAHASIVGHITEAELRRYLTETEVAGGFGNRFLFALVRRSQKLPKGGSLSPDVLDRVATFFRNFASFAPGEVARTPDAELIWSEIYHSIDDDVDGLFGAITARAEAQMLRLSVAYALLDRTPEINVDHVNAAKAVWDYCEESARIIFGDASGDPVEDDLLIALRAAGEHGLTAAEQSAVFSRHISAARLESARAHLEERGLAITEKRTDTGGRPALVTYYEQANKANLRKKGAAS